MADEGSLRFNVVLIVAGEERGFLSDNLWENMVQYVVAPLEQRDDANVTSVVCVEAMHEQLYCDSQNARDMWSKLRVARVFPFPKHVAGVRRRLSGTYGQWNRNVTAETCYAKYTKPQLGSLLAAPASHFIRLRTDMVWMAPIAPLSDLPPTAISARARFFRGSPGEYYPKAAFAVDASFGCLIRCRMRCVSLDDQFAIIPAIFAEAYFMGRDSYAKYGKADLLRSALASGFPPPPRNTIWEYERCYGADRTTERNFGTQNGECVPNIVDSVITSFILALGVPIDVRAYAFALYSKYGRNAARSRESQRWKRGANVTAMMTNGYPCCPIFENETETLAARRQLESASSPPLSQSLPLPPVAAAAKIIQAPKPGARLMENGLQIPTPWPPRDVKIVNDWNLNVTTNWGILEHLQEPPLSGPPYLSASAVRGAVQLNSKRQLFVDDFLVQSNTRFERVFHRPSLDNGGKPVMEASLKSDPPAVPYPGGLHRCWAPSKAGGKPLGADSERPYEYRLFWHENRKQQVEMAVSDDLKAWRRSRPMKAPYGAKSPIFKCQSLDDAWTFMTTDSDGSCRTMIAYAKACPRLGPGIIFRYDAGTNSWLRIAETGVGHDRSSFWWNPFSSVFVFHVRLDFAGTMRTVWYYESPVVNDSTKLQWEISGNFGSRGRPPGAWYSELQRDWKTADSSPGGRVKIPLPYIALDAQDQRDLPNYNNSLVATEGDCLARGCPAMKPGMTGKFCREWSNKFKAWKEKPGAGPQPHPPAQLEVKSQGDCLRLTDVYSMEAVPYESLVVGLFALWQGGQRGDIKHTQLWTGFSRDGFHFDRPRPSTARYDDDARSGMVERRLLGEGSRLPSSVKSAMLPLPKAMNESNLNKRCKRWDRAGDPFYPGPLTAGRLGPGMTHEFEEDTTDLQSMLAAASNVSIGAAARKRIKYDLQQQSMFLNTVRSALAIHSPPQLPAGTVVTVERSTHNDKSRDLAETLSDAGITPPEDQDHEAAAVSAGSAPSSLPPPPRKSLGKGRGYEGAAFIGYPGRGWKNTQAVANGIQSLGSRTYFMYTARHEKEQIAGVFTSSFRRDAFASMLCHSSCRLVTVPLAFDLRSAATNALWVNADVRNGTLQVEILPGEGEEDQATATSVSFEGIDGTALAVRWTGIRGVDLAEAIGKSALPTASYRLRFTATTGVSLYSFWLGPAESESRPTALSPWQALGGR